MYKTKEVQEMWERFQIAFSQLDKEIELVNLTCQSLVGKDLSHSQNETVKLNQVSFSRYLSVVTE